MQDLTDTSVGHTHKQKAVYKNSVSPEDSITIPSEAAALFDKWYRDNWLNYLGKKSCVLSHHTRWRQRSYSPPQVKEHRGLPEAGGGREGSSRDFRGSIALLTPDFLPPEQQYNIFC